MWPLEWDTTAGWSRRKMKTYARWRTGWWRSISYAIVHVRARGRGSRPCSPRDSQQVRPHQHSISYVLCDNESAVISTNRPLTDSIFHRIEGEHDLVSTIKDLQENWCRGIEIMYEWVKGHAYDLNRELNRAERINVIADKQCYIVRQQANGRGVQGPQQAYGTARLVHCSFGGAKSRAAWKKGWHNNY
jgi:hypothetical protein